LSFESLGMIETSSVSSSLKIINEINKISKTKLIGKQLIGNGIVTIFIQGDLGALRKALNTGAEVINYSNDFRTSHIIPWPHKDLFQKIKLERSES
jgi:ethanolamine utilization protein EutM